MREDDLIKSVEPIIDELTALNQKIENVKTIKGDKGDEGEKGTQGEQGETGQEGIGVNTKEWTKGIYREGQIVQHFIGQQFKALKDTDKEPSHEDWERIGVNGFRWTGIKSDKTDYKEGDLFIDSGTTFLIVEGKARMFAQRGKNAVDGKNGKDGKDGREFLHVKWHNDGISFIYDDGTIVEADVEGLNEIHKRMSFIEGAFTDNENIDAPIRRYAGLYKTNTSYSIGDTVTNQKSLWLCIETDGNSSSLDPDKWVKICGAMGGVSSSGGGGRGGDSYTKAEIDAQQKAQDTKIEFNNDEIARQQIEITNNSSEISKNVTAINNNITAIGTLSGQVSQNSEDIAELQDSIFFTSAYSADYPSAPNRDPENGNIYLQAFAMFSYSYASATQIFASKTDESGNVRQFTAVKPGDSIVLNQVDSPNYGRYELVSIEDVSSSYVVMNVIPKLGEGTVITGVKVAFQAFPRPGNDIWTEEDDPTHIAPEAIYPGNIVVDSINIGTAANGKTSNVMLGRNATGQNKNASGFNNVAIGDNAFAKMGAANDCVAVGFQALKANESGDLNVAVGAQTLLTNIEGQQNAAIGDGALQNSLADKNTALGTNAGSTLTTGGNNTLIGNNSQPSTVFVSNEITLGDTDVIKVRMGNGDIIYPPPVSVSLEVNERLDALEKKLNSLLSNNSTKNKGK